MKYILVVDQSTSATKSMLFNPEGEVVQKYSLPHEQIYPNRDWIEHDPMEIYQNVLACIDKMTEYAGIENIDALGITNQRETTVVWDKTTGEPISNAVVWQDQRGADICTALEEYSDEVYARTGLTLSPYFSAAKAAHLLQNIPGAQQKADQGDLLFGTVDSWLIYKLNEGRLHVCDYSNACRTQLFNIKTLEWDSFLCDLFHIPMHMLPKVMDSNADYGVVGTGKAKGLKIAGVIGDSHGALLGQGCVRRGMVKATYGTGSSVALNTGAQPVYVKGLSTSLAWRISGQQMYEVEGNITCTGDALAWMRDGMELVPDLNEVEQLANSVPDNGGVYVVPAFSGLGPPYWDEEARALICGISRSSQKAHIVRAFQEQIGYQIMDVLATMVESGGFDIQELRTDGGPTKNNFLMQFQSDVAGTKVKCASIEEISGRGAAFAAGIQIGWWSDIDETAASIKQGKEFEPSGKESLYQTYYEEWKKAVARARL